MDDTFDYPSAHDRFFAAIDHVASITDDAERVAAATRIFGKAWIPLAEVINTRCTRKRQ